MVWLARHVVTDQQVALKVWRRPLTDDDVRDRFVAEARLLAQLAGEPHVVEVLWTSTPDEPLPWTAMRTAGIDLATWMRGHPDASLDERLDIADGLLAGLGALHRRGLVHRDVTPRNVLVDAAGQVRLCDFGLVIEAGGLTADPAAGTPGHLAPELEHAQPPTLRSDVFSAAATIAALLGPSMVPDIEHLVVTRALSQRPEDRPRDADDFRRSLARVRSAARAAEATGASGPGPRPVDDVPSVGAEDRASSDGGSTPARTPARGRSVTAAAGLVVALGAGLGLATAAEHLGHSDADAATSSPTPAAASASSTPQTTPLPFPGAATFRVGRSHASVLELDQALIRLGCTHYHDGDGYQPSTRFTEYTRLNLRAFQLANPELDGQPDGYPGPRTWAMLFSPGSRGCS